MVKYEGERGFTLIELLLTLCIIGITLIPLLTYFANSVFFTNEAEKRTQGIKLANTLLENIKAEARKNPDIISLLDEADVLGRYINLEKYSFKAGDYKARVWTDDTIDVDGDGEEDGWVISIRIYWNESQRSVTLSSLVMRR